MTNDPHPFVKAALESDLQFINDAFGV